MNVYEEAKYPFLREETMLLKRAIGIGIPVLGICLGAQMIAKAAGAAVVKSPIEEVGWFNVDLTTLGGSDRLLLGLPNSMEVFQWHGDMFHVPVGGGLLIKSRSCPHQALKFGSAYGLQFHVEVTKDMLKQWFAQDPRHDAILERMDKVEQRFLSCANAIFGNFFKLVTQYHRKHAPFHGGRCC